MSLTSLSRRRRFTAIAAAGLTAGAMTLVLAPTTAANAATGKLTNVSMFATQTKVRTTTGKRVTTYINASKSGKNASFYVSLTKGGESHSWNFPITAKQFALATSGKGKLVPAKSKVSPFAKVKLTIKKAGALKTQRCSGQVVSKSRKLKVSGTFWFNTKSGKKWGKVGSKSKKFTFKTSATGSWSYQNDADCGDYLQDCTNTVTWSAYTGKTSFYGTNRKVYANRSVTLAKPKGATRSDSRTLTARSATFTKTGDTGKLVIVGGGALKGSATLTGETSEYSSYDSKCKKGGTIRSTFYNSTTFTNGAKALRVSDIYGSMSVPNLGSDFVEGQGSYLTQSTKVS